MGRERKRAFLQKAVYPLLGIEERYIIQFLVGVSAPVQRFKAYVPLTPPKASAFSTTESWKR